MLPEPANLTHTHHRVHVAVTPILCNVLVSFIGHWMLSAAASEFNTWQYGALKGRSTTHALVNILYLGHLFASPLVQQTVCQSSVKWQSFWQFQSGQQCKTKQHNLPALFKIFINKLIVDLKTQSLGCFFDKIWDGCVLCADDIYYLPRSVVHSSRQKIAMRLSMAQVFL
jgi:hypothetical protein